MTDVVRAIEAGAWSGGDLLDPERKASLNPPDRVPMSPLPADGTLDLSERAAVPVDCAVSADLAPTELLRALSEASPFPLLICRQQTVRSSTAMPSSASCSEWTRRRSSGGA
jgi:hypothetical protein